MRKHWDCSEVLNTKCSLQMANQGFLLAWTWVWVVFWLSTSQHYLIHFSRTSMKPPVCPQHLVTLLTAVHAFPSLKPLLLHDLRTYILQDASCVQPRTFLLRTHSVHDVDDIHSFHFLLNDSWSLHYYDFFILLQVLFTFPSSALAWDPLGSRDVSLLPTSACLAPKHEAL